MIRRINKNSFVWNNETRLGRVAIAHRLIGVILAALIALAVVAVVASAQDGKGALNQLDAIRIEYQQLREENARLQQQVVACQSDKTIAEVRQKYGAGPQDQLTREIVDGKAVYRFVKAETPPVNMDNTAVNKPAN